MDIEQLNKSQTVLLTLLVSFVTSIATGIVTVALMEQGITPVTQTINRVVERTKEVVVTQPQIVTEEKTVIVKESDSIAAAVKKNSMSVVAVYVVTPTTTSVSETSPEAQTASVLLHDGDVSLDGTLAQNTGSTPTETLTLLGRGVVVHAGSIATDASIVSEGAQYKVVFNDGSASYGSVTKTTQGIAVITLEEPLGVGGTIGSATLAANDTVVVLSGSARSRAITVVVAAVDGTAIDVGTSDVALGSVLLDTNGTVVGFSTSAIRNTKGSSWFDANILTSVPL